jgi:hypothetical protein
MTAPEGEPEKALTRQELLDLLAKAKIQVDYEGDADGAWELGVDREQSIIRCRERDGKITFVGIEHPSDRVLAGLCRPLDKRGWLADSE